MDMVKLKYKSARPSSSSMPQDTNTSSAQKSTGEPLNKFPPEEDSQENISSKESEEVWKDFNKIMLMFVSVTDLISKHPLNKHAEPLIGSSEKVWSFIGVPASGLPNKSPKLISFVKNTHSTNLLSNNLNTIFTVVTKWKSTLLNFLPTKSSELQFGHHWQAESWQENITMVFLKEADSTRIKTWNISSIDISMRPRRNKLWKDWESSRN